MRLIVEAGGEAEALADSRTHRRSPKDITGNNDVEWASGHLATHHPSSSLRRTNSAQICATVTTRSNRYKHFILESCFHTASS